MTQIIPTDQVAQVSLPPADPNLPAFQPELCSAHHSDSHVMTLRDGMVVARASLWWTRIPPLPGKRAGILGHFAALDAAGAGEVLAAACDELRRHGCDIAIGPMDGNTWRRYRLLTDRGTEPTFFLEPDNPNEWPGFFEQAGFSPLAMYFSALNRDLSVVDQRMPDRLKRLENAGVKLRQLDRSRFTAELRRIYAVSRESFQSNFLYTPVDEIEFLAQYEPIKAHIVPELVLLAEQADTGAPVGFAFAIPDLAQARRRLPVDTIVLKTLAVLPSHASVGLGGGLMSACQQAARTLGYRRVIHALMHENNRSLELSRRYAQPFRRYTLYSRAL